MLLDKLQADLASAQKTRNQIRVDTLRFLLGGVMNLQIEKYPPNKGGNLTDEDVLAVIKKQVKTHNESIDMFSKANREDLVGREKEELVILQTYLPVPMGEDQVKIVVAEVKRNNPTADFGTLMKLVLAQLGGQADGAVVAKLVREP